MTLLWAPWLALAMLAVLLRAALGLRGLAAGDHTDAVADDRALADSALAVKLGADIVVEACRHASRAHAVGERQAALHLLHCARGGARALALDLRSALTDWKKFTWALGVADPLPPIHPGDFRRPEAQVVVWLENGVRFLLAADVARLRLRLFVLGVHVSLLVRAYERVTAPVHPGQWTALQELSADLALLTLHALRANRALRPGASLSAADVSLAT